MGLEDRSLVRSEACFRHIFAQAGYRPLIFEDWDPTEKNYSILNAVFAPDDFVTIPRHKDCLGKLTPQEWDSVATDQSTQQQLETKIPNQ